MIDTAKWDFLLHPSVFQNIFYYLFLLKMRLIFIIGSDGNK